MAVELNGNNSRIDFGDGLLTEGLTQLSILVWAKQLSYIEDSGVFTVGDPTTTNQLTRFWMNDTTSGDPNGNFRFRANWTTSAGVWVTQSVVFPINTVAHGVLTYDSGLTTNDPLMYGNGVSKTIRERFTPAGTYMATGATQTLIGQESFVGALSSNAIIYSICVYNRILSAAEILDAYTNGLLDYNYIPSTSGLVFRPNLNCAKGLTYASFPGTTLGASNTFFDLVTCNLGVPAGSPIGR